jgi:hypothetical protein
MRQPRKIAGFPGQSPHRDALIEIHSLSYKTVTATVSVYRGHLYLDEAYGRIRRTCTASGCLGRTQPQTIEAGGGMTVARPHTAFLCISAFDSTKPTGNRSAAVLFQTSGMPTRLQRQNRVPPVPVFLPLRHQSSAHLHFVILPTSHAVRVSPSPIGC